MAKETEQTKAAAYCPNCQRPAIKEGNEIFCEACDATFAISRTAGARVKKMGELEEIRGRLERIEASLPGDEPTETDTGTETETNTEDGDQYQDGEILPR